MKNLFRTGRGQFVVFIGIFVVLAVAALLIAKPGKGIFSASKPGTSSATPNSSATTGNPAKSSSGTITTGDSKANCITLKYDYGVLNKSEVAAATSLTGITYNCLETFANPAPTWADWTNPWVFGETYDGWQSWLAANPTHQIVMGVDLIPQSISNNNDPLTWEQACAAGSYNQYATTLAKDLVSHGAGGIVIRLGIEANGSWEADYVGSTTTEMNAWAKCYDNEVTAMRAVPGTHLMFVWNPNICTQDFPLSQWYPGNSYVDIIGADSYDVDCTTNKTVGQEGWTAYATDSAAGSPGDPNFPSVDNIAAFAKSNGKPMSFPEWGLVAGKDDPAYMTDMGNMFNSDNFAFESYYDTNTNDVAPLGSSTPSATAAYSQAFK